VAGEKSVEVAGRKIRNTCIINSSITVRAPAQKSALRAAERKTTKKKSPYRGAQSERK
jgi:hypothetical protein